MMNDKILVKMTDINNDYMYAAFETTNWTEPLKMFSFLKENDLPYDITVVEEQYKDSIFFINDISIQFGSKEGLNVIEIYVERFSY